ncbi:hypothetical protein NPIL_353971 [Nephila pilipes]|uniref:Uncharacterized protein n=1 Tax=Nephila pilipes TaxID=299642 RepID=A0A8X6UD00_NEPPI|nr:hypothetical protein NPIL_353971 [Nephila pilipes]
MNHTTNSSPDFARDRLRGMLCGPEFEEDVDSIESTDTRRRQQEEILVHEYATPAFENPLLEHNAVNPCSQKENKYISVLNPDLVPSLLATQRQGLLNPTLEQLQRYTVCSGRRRIKRDKRAERGRRKDTFLISSSEEN